MWPQLSFNTYVSLTEGTKTLSEGILGIESRVLETREEGFASGTHTFDDRGVQCEIQFPFMGLSTSSQKEDIIISGDDEDDFVYPVGGNDQSVVDLGEIFAVVDDADQSPSNGITGTIPREFRSGEPRTVDDDVRVKALSKLRFLVQEIAVDGLGDELCALGLDDLHEPRHSSVGIDDGSEMFVCVDDAIGRVDVVFDGKVCITIEPANACLHDLLHLLVLSRVLFNLFTEEECG